MSPIRPKRPLPRIWTLLLLLRMLVPLSLTTNASIAQIRNLDSNVDLSLVTYTIERYDCQPRCSILPLTRLPMHLVFELSTNAYCCQRLRLLSRSQGIALSKVEFDLTDSAANFASAIAGSDSKHCREINNFHRQHMLSTAAQADTIAGSSQAVVYSLSDTASAIAAATAGARNEAVRHHCIGYCRRRSQATTIQGASNSWYSLDQCDSRTPQRISPVPLTQF